MNTITQIARRRQAIVLWAKDHGVTSAARRYNVSREYVYRWLKRYDGTLESLKDRSHRPKSHPNQHTEEELKLIRKIRKSPYPHCLRLASTVWHKTQAHQAIYAKT